MNRLIGDTGLYIENKDKGFLPVALGSLRHKIPWPIKKDTENIHISAFYNDNHYVIPKIIIPGLKDLHDGVDIQVASKTHVIAPETSKVIHIDHCDRRGNLVDILLYSEESKIVYDILHIDKDSIPERISDRAWFDRYTDTEVSCGEIIGEVGFWPLELRDAVRIPEDVEEIYGRCYHHIHLRMFYYPDRSELRGASYLENSFNPLLVLEEML
ncbi:MAG: hypothetical protein U9O53_05315 [archaeon]|nr:hypothetical protein [archaeon]